MKISKIVSGGQTGADRGGLDAAIEHNFPYGGWCPKGRKSEDGVIPAKYSLNETSSGDYKQRTELNVKDSDATLIFCYGIPTGGTKLTVEFAEKHKKPYFVTDLDEKDDGIIVDKIIALINGLSLNQIVLNIAGSRESKAKGIQSRVKELVSAVIIKQGQS